MRKLRIMSLSDKQTQSQHEGVAVITTFLNGHDLLGRRCDVVVFNKIPSLNDIEKIIPMMHKGLFHYSKIEKDYFGCISDMCILECTKLLSSEINLKEYNYNVGKLILNHMNNFI